MMRRANPRMVRARKERVREEKEKVSPRTSMARRWFPQRRMAGNYATLSMHKGVRAGVVDHACRIKGCYGNHAAREHQKYAKKDDEPKS